MDTFRHGLQLAALVVLMIGPLLILSLRGPKDSRWPGLLKYLVGSVAVCTAAYWLLHFSAGYILDTQFREVVPSGEWTYSDELRWTDAERRVVAAHFGDGGRNVLALFAPIILLANACVVWVAQQGFRGLRNRLAT